MCIRDRFKTLQQQTDDINRVSREHLTGIRVVRAYNAESYQEEKFEKKNATLTRTNMFANRAMAVMMPGVELIMNGLTLSVYWIGAALIAAAAVTERLILFSDMMVFSSYAVQLLMAFMMLVVVLTLLPRASVSANRINEALDTEPVILSLIHIYCCSISFTLTPCGNVPSGNSTSSAEEALITAATSAGR